MQNIGFAGFLACLPFFMYRPENAKKMVIIGIITSILPIFYVQFYDPYTRLSILSYLHGAKNGIVNADTLKTINSFNYIWICGYLIVPLIRMLYSGFQTKNITKRRQLFSLFFTLLCLNLLCTFIFVLGPMGQTYTTLSVDNLLCFPDSGNIYTYNHTYLPIIALILSNAMLIFLFRFRGLDRIDFFKNIQISRMALKPNKSIRNILHTYKNEMLSVNMIAKQLESVDDSERRDYLVHRLLTISENALSNVLKITSNYKNIISSSTCCNITECIETVLSGTAFDDNILVEKLLKKDMYALCDRYRMESVLENIFRNAQEAIRLANRTEGKITITLESDYEWVFIKITDNGVGIPKKDLTKIFNAFYSTKFSSNNWGIGLNYVFRSMKVMKGFVYAQSEVDKYTTFTIMLQKSSPDSKNKSVKIPRRNRRLLWKK